MLKKAVVLSLVCLLLLAAPVSVSAMLIVLEPEVSEELREIAKTHLALTENIAADTIYILDGWVQTYWNISVDVYMVTAVIDRGLATEREVQIPVRVDQKVVLSDAEVAVLKEQDAAMTPDEPIMRALAVPDEAGADNQNLDQPVSDQPLNVTQDAAVEPGLPPGAEQAQGGNSGSLIYYLAAGAILILLSGTAYVIKRRRA